MKVRDTGVGVNPVDIPKLFNKVSQGDSASRNYATTGLGLAICKRFASTFYHQRNRIVPVSMLNVC